MKVRYFGFGSLVNRDTRDQHGQALRVRLRGWRRGWEHRTASDPKWCVLSIAREQATVIEGVLVTIDASQLPALDLREAGYQRHVLSLGDFDYLPGQGTGVSEDEWKPLNVGLSGHDELQTIASQPDVEPSEPPVETHSDETDSEKHGESSIFVYISSEQQRGPANQEYPLLQSYIDCVMAGYDREYGEAGVRRFVDSTHHWNAPMYNDRAAPHYPRAVIVPPERLAFYDELTGSRRSDPGRGD